MSLARGWSPTRRQAIVARFVLGTLLLVTPLWVGYVPLDLDGTEYRYRTTDVTTEGDRIGFEDDDVLRLHGVQGVACASDNPFLQGRVCGFERELVREGARTVPSVYDETPEPEYVRVDEAYFRRGTNRTENGTVVSVERVDPEVVLADVAEPPTQLSLAGEWGVRTGSVATDRRADFGGQVVSRSDGSYELLYLRGYSRSSTAGIEPLVWLVGIGTGAVLLRNGYRELES
jgi:hypothetical protein